MTGRVRAAVRAVAGAAVVAVLTRAARGEDAPSADAVRAARTEVFARPEFIYGTPGRKDSFLRMLLGWWQGMITEFQQRHPLLFLFSLGALGLVLLVLVGHMVWTWRVARRTAYAAPDPLDLEAALRRLDAAPFRARAAEHARAGRFDEALRDLYTALLLTLDRRGALRYAGHKALLDYRFEASGDAAARSALDRFAVEYPPGSFGRRPPDAAHFAVLAATVDGLAGGHP